MGPTQKSTKTAHLHALVGLESGIYRASATECVANDGLPKRHVDSVKLANPN